MMVKKAFIILIILIHVFFLCAQEKVILYSHYTFNGMAINPAYTGSHGMLTAGLSHRNQWIGFEGAPSYNIISLHTPYKNTPMSAGLLVMNESMGLRKFTGIYINYAYKIELNQGNLAFGLKGGIGTGKMDPVDLGDDIVFSVNTRSYFLPNFGLGAYFYNRKWYAGLSIPSLLGYITNKSGEIIAYHSFKRYAYYATAGVKLDLVSNWQIQPSLLLEYEKAGGAIADAGFGVLYKDALRFGASYRTKQSLVFLADYKINYQLRIGMAYDYGVGTVNKYNRSSVEIAIEYNFGYKINASNPTIF